MEKQADKEIKERQAEQERRVKEVEDEDYRVRERKYSPKAASIIPEPKSPDSAHDSDN